MKKILILILLLIPSIALATSATLPAIPLPTDLIGASLDKAITRVMTDLENISFRILFGMSLLQLIITGYGQLVSGEIEASIGKYARSFLWLSFCVWLLMPSGDAGNFTNGGHYIRAVADEFIGLAGSWTATQNSTFDSGDILLTGLYAYGKITVAVIKASSTNAVNAFVSLFVPGVSFLTALMVFFISAVIIISCAYIALKVFMVKLEISLVIAIAPLSMSFLGLNALRDQGMAPFKSMLALVYRIVLLGAIVASIGTVADFLSNYVDGLSYGLMADVFSPLIAAAFGFVLLAFLAHKSDSIASSLANGSASLGAGDMSSAVAAGVATGMAVATGGAAAAAGASKSLQSGSDFIKGLTSRGGSISNASGTRLGGGRDAQPVGTAPAASLKTPEPSLQSLQSDPSHPSQQSGSGSGATTGSPATAAQKIDSMIANGEATNPAAAGVVSDHLKSMNPGSAGSFEAPASSSPGTGSGSSAGIGGASSSTDQKLDKLLDNFGQGGGKQKPSFGDRLATLNDHVSRESSATHVNINTHHD